MAIEIVDFPMKSVIFRSYVKLPEVTLWFFKSHIKLPESNGMYWDYKIENRCLMECNVGFIGVAV